ncbi:MAG: phosphotransferase [Phycisphaerae bacterium]|jgi:hypothetical protein
MRVPAEVLEVAGRFAVAGRPVACVPWGGGHINDTYAVTCNEDGRETRYLLQRINTAVFRNPLQVTENIARVTEHIAGRLRAAGVYDIERRVLQLVLTAEPNADRREAATRAADPPEDASGREPTPADATGRQSHSVDATGRQPAYIDAAGRYWRMYRFIERTRISAAVTSPAEAFAAGEAYGTFQRLLIDLPGPRLHETIPGFHDTPARYAALDAAIAADACGRVAEAQPEIDFAQRRRDLAGALLDLHNRGLLPERVVHNDAKMDNVLLDATTGTGQCVVDLDTVMPGLAPFDFGDMVRTMTTFAAEDEQDLRRVVVQMPLFTALARGYLESAGPFLLPAERDHLVTAGKLITLEQGVRFLTDYLRGDTYYKTTRPGQNLDRTRAQFALVGSIETVEQKMNAVVART